MSISFKDKLIYAADYQTRQILDALRQRGIHLPEEEIQERLILAMHGYSFTEKIVKQIEACPKRWADMSLEERYAVARWPEHQGGSGTRETSRAVIESLTSGSSIASRIQSAEAKVAASNHDKKGREIGGAR